MLRKETSAVTHDLLQRCRPNAGDRLQLGFASEQQPLRGVDAPGDQSVDGAVGKSAILEWRACKDCRRSKLHGGNRAGLLFWRWHGHVAVTPRVAKSAVRGRPGASGHVRVLGAYMPVAPAQIKGSCPRMSRRVEVFAAIFH